MDLMNKFLNVVAPCVALTLLPSFLPLYFLFKFLHYIVRTLTAEDVAGKVVLITGASSGIGKHLAFEYARRGACLILAARRERQLREVASQAELMGSPYALAVPGDVTEIKDCKRFIDAAIEHCGRLDHLVANAGIVSMCLFEDYTDITKPAPAVDVNFWGSAFCTYLAIPHLKQTKGKITVICSAAAWLPAPRMSFYNASHAAKVALYETLRVELGGDVGITIVTPGLIKSEITDGKFLNKDGKLEVDQEMRDVQISVLPMQSTEECAWAIVNSACRGDKYLTTPSWCRMSYYWKVFWPEIVEWFNRMLLMSGPEASQRDTLSKKILDITNEIKEFLAPGTVPFDEIKTRLDYQKYKRY